MKTYSKNQVEEATFEYFGGDDLSSKVWVDKYCLKSDNIYFEKTPYDMHKRLSKEFSRIENKYPNPMSEPLIFSLLHKFRYIIPGGSPMEGIGNNLKVQSLSNCYVIGNDEDSYGSIMKIDEEQVHIMRRRGGVGSDISHLRPRGSKTTCAANTSTGVVPFAERYSNSTRETAQEGRRGARMISLDITHPDAEEFIDAKLEVGKITGSNISLRITDEFMKAVESDSDFLQHFPIDLNTENVDLNDFDYDITYDRVNTDSSKQVYFRKVKAKRLWDKIIHNAWKSAEPGVLFIDHIRRESPSDCYGKKWETKSSNPCGEIPMNPYSSCILLAMNLYSYVKNPFTKKSSFDFDLFEEHAMYAQRLIDDIVDLEIEKIDQILAKVKSDPESEDTKMREFGLWTKIREKIKQGRRTGLGITGEGDMLAALGLRYGTESANEFAEKVQMTLSIQSYKSSIKLAQERGSFEVWDINKEKDNPFINRIFDEGFKGDFIILDGEPISWLKLYKLHGRRNIANLTIAPTGTTSLMTQTTSGIEPVFKPFYKRRRKVSDPKLATFKDELGDLWEEYFVIHHKFAIWFKIQLESGTSDFHVWYDGLSYNLRDIKNWLSNLDSKLLENIFEQSPYFKATSDDVDYLGKVMLQGRIQRWIDHSISVTVNMPKDVNESVVSGVYMLAHKVGCKGVTVYRDGSRSGVLVGVNEGSKNEIVRSNSPKRPMTVECDIMNISRGKQAFTLVVGLLKNKPMEIFALERLSNMNFNDNIEKGVLRKVRSGVYELSGFYNGRKYIIDNIIDFISPDEQKDTRNFSLMLRHGIPSNEIIDQINEYATITSFDKVIAKALSYYLNGETLKSEDRVCPECGSKNIKVEDGCAQCLDCSWSKCS